MNDQFAPGLLDGRSLFDTLPVGLVVYDEDRRLILANPAYCRALGLPPATFRPLSTVAENARMLAYRGLLGPGDPEAQAAELAGRDPTKEHRARSRHADGRSYDSWTVPVPGGGHMVCVTETTALTAVRDEADALVARVHAAIGDLRIGLAVFSPSRTLAFHNRRFPELLGLPPQAVGIGTPFGDLLQAMQAREDYTTMEGNLLLAGQLAQDRSRPAAFRRRRAGGQVIDVQSEPLPDGGWTLTVSDITRMSDAEDEARRRAGLLDTVLRQVPHGIAVYGPDRRLRLVNDAYDSIMRGAPIAIGDSVEEIIRTRVHAGEFGPGDPDALIRQLSLHDISQPQLRRRTRPNGATIDIRTAPLPDGGHISVVTDSSALVAAQTELTRRAGAMDAMLASIRHGIILWDVDRRIVAANAVVADLLHAPPGLITRGLSLDDLVASALERGNLGEGAAARTRARWLLDQDRGQPQHDQRLTRDGRILEVRSDPAPHGGFVTTYTDVTHVRVAEDALRLSKTAAEAANTAKSRFLAAMSAELRCPLNTILREADAVSRDAADQVARMNGRGMAHGAMDAARTYESCETIGIAARSLLGMIDTILDMARLEAGRFDLADDAVDLAQVVRACLRQFDATAAAAEVALVVDLPAQLPRLRADERRLRQALGHVLSNALKFTDAMGSVSITARHDWTTGDLLVQVHDTGIGIAAADLERVFEPFTQIDPSRDGGRPRGAGLGLYVSRILMRAHGGDLVLRSVPGQQTTAILTVPANRVMQDAPRDAL